ncbi:serine/threonine-protein kinase [Streptomyces sp. KR80]|uniref:serine/threonine-protein kinase n=1 Tax=Streptomyces sp. KR80 TaxID=3457426 RepID=UPI003FD31A05
MSSGEYGQDWAGRLLAGRYRVVRQLGRGGMGVVCRAVDEVLGREVAVKVLRTYRDSSGPELTDLRLRMQREARAAARIKHPGVIAVHDVAEDDGCPLIIMELIDGPSLDDVIREHGVIGPREAAAIGAKVMEALDAAHRAGVLHRDVKPGNVLLDRGSTHADAPPGPGAGVPPLGGRVVLTDFGIATMDDPGDGAATRITQSGDIVGSLDYLAPERAQGQEPGAASDVWSLGATLYAAVEGSAPFRRTSTYSTITAIVAEPMPEPRRAGPLTPVLRELMHKDPQRRPDAPRARKLLEAVAAGLPYEGPGDAPDLGGAGASREPTVLDTPRFGPVRDVPLPSGPPQAIPPQPGPPGAPAHSIGYAADAPLVTSGSSQGSEGGRRRRVVVAAAVAAALLAGAGVTAAAMIDGFGDSQQAASRRTPSAPGSAPGEEKPGEQGKSAGEKAKRAKPTGKTSPSPGTTKPAAGGGDGETTGGSDSGGTGDGSDSGGDSAGDGSGVSTSTSGGGSSGGSTGGAEDPAPAPVCHAIGGGKYNCQVWKTAKSYNSAGTEVGVLNAGTNYFYCQTQGRRETYDRWTNVWWAKTDDDSGNTGVYISDVYIKGGDNDQPVPGLPIC